MVRSEKGWKEAIRREKKQLEAVVDAHSNQQNILTSIVARLKGNTR